MSPGPIGIQPFQRQAWKLLGSPARSVLLYGGSRSGKTYITVLWMVLRALTAPRSTQIILRHRFNSLRASIIEGTLPKVCEDHWPGQSVYRMDKTAWFAEFTGGGRIWLGGLDDKQRTEKILGQEHSTIYLNEASQISYPARTKALSRLSQRAGLRLKEICDENPPMEGHWTHRLWISGIEPATSKALANREQYVSLRMNPRENPILPAEYIQTLEAFPPNERARFLEGLFGVGTEHPLWTYDSIETARLPEATPETLPPGITTIVVAVDPSGCSGEEDTRSDEIGIVVVGLGDGGRVYVLEDASGRFGPSGPKGWGAVVSRVFHKWGADRVVGEVNYGGAMVDATVMAADKGIPFRPVTASRAKHVRADPVSVLFHLDPKPKAFFCGHFPEMEAQLVQFSSAGYHGDRSPDRADAMIWGVYALGVVKMPHQGAYEYMKQEAERITQASPAARAVSRATEADLVTLLAPPHIWGTISVRAASYVVENRQVRVRPSDVEDLRGLGFTPV